MIAFYAKPSYFLEDENGLYPQRISSIVRAEQIANYLGWPLNPKEGRGVHVKPLRLERVKPDDYVDVLDDLACTMRMKDRPEVKVLAMTTAHKVWLESFLPNEVIHIPHQHLNFEREKKTGKGKVCGYVGANNRFHKKVNEEVGGVLKEAGFEFKTLLNFTTRDEVIEFYKGIDIQVIGYFDFHTDVPYYHEKKIVDAMSFGIPTIAGYKLGYKDVEKYYTQVKSLEEMVEAVKDSNPDSERLIAKAEEYHISKIAELYKKL